MNKFTAMVKAQKAVLARFGTTVGPESEAAYKRYYLFYLGQPSARSAPFYNRFSTHSLVR